MTAMPSAGTKPVIKLPPMASTPPAANSSTGNQARAGGTNKPISNRIATPIKATKPSVGEPPSDASKKSTTNLSRAAANRILMMASSNLAMNLRQAGVTGRGVSRIGAEAATVVVDRRWIQPALGIDGALLQQFDEIAH